MDGRVYSRASRKKISSVIARYTLNNDREKRAFEETENSGKKGKHDNYLEGKIAEITSTFRYGYFTYLYYRFLDKFKVEPVSFDEIFESVEFLRVETESNAMIINHLKAEKK